MPHNKSPKKPQLSCAGPAKTIDYQNYKIHINIDLRSYHSEDEEESYESEQFD
mgnify:CR=1 FL=1